MANIGDYATTYEQFDWETPERFNFGRDVVDAWPEDRPAMIWLGTSGEERSVRGRHAAWCPIHARRSARRCSASAGSIRPLIRTVSSMVRRAPSA